MKTLLIIAIIVVGMSGQAFSMGHPHNMFAARKQLRAKTSASVAKPKVSSSISIQHAVQATKMAFCERLLAALSNARPARTY